MLHVETRRGSSAAGKAIFCEKPVGGTPEHGRRAAAERAGVITGVGYNYRFAPLVRTRRADRRSAIGEVRNYRGRFFSMYGADELGGNRGGSSSEAGYGASSDLLSHAVDLAHFLVGPIERLVGTSRRSSPSGPRPAAPRATTGAAGRPTRAEPVTNEDYAGHARASSRRARAERSTRAAPSSGPRARWRSRCTRARERSAGASSGSTSCGCTARPPTRARLHDRARRRPVPAPWRLRARKRERIGFEDLVTIEDHEF